MRRRQPLQCASCSSQSSRPAESASRHRWLGSRDARGRLCPPRLLRLAHRVGPRRQGERILAGRVRDVCAWNGRDRIVEYVDLPAGQPGLARVPDPVLVQVVELHATLVARGGGPHSVMHVPDGKPATLGRLCRGANARPHGEHVRIRQPGGPVRSGTPSAHRVHGSARLQVDLPPLGDGNGPPTGLASPIPAVQVSDPVNARIGAGLVSGSGSDEIVGPIWPPDPNPPAQ